MDKFLLETERLGLRCLTRDDFGELHKILSDKDTMRYYPQPFDEKKTREWIEWNIENYRLYGFGLWAVILKESGAFIGDCGITMQNIHGDGILYPEIGYHISKAYQKMGYASEAAGACLEFAFANTDSNELFSYQKWTNIPSRRVAEKIGMSLREEYADEKNGKTSVFSITRAEYNEKIKAVR